jgi:hypothetical protein
VQPFEDGNTATVTNEESAMYGSYEGLPAAANVQQAVCLAQLEILRRLERQRTGAPAGR